MSGKVLLVDDDPAVREALGQTLELADFEPILAGSFVEAKDRIRAEFDGVILSDIRMPGRDGFHLLDYALEQDSELPVILLTGEGDIPMAVRAMGRGAFDFLEKPCSPANLTAVIGKALKTRALVLENRALKMQLEAGDAAARLLFGTSEQAETLRRTARLAGRSGADVLVYGAPGSGVSKVAEVVHLCSPRAKGPFEKRAAKDMTRNRLERIWQGCTGGTLFLDEVSLLSVDGQLALGDLMEAGGATLVAGTTLDLAEEVAQRRFNPDLYYRLQVMQVRIPPLSERPGDIPVLFRHYVAQAAEQAGIAPPEIPAELNNSLIARDWPGNARALMSEAMRFVLGLENAPAPEQEMGLVERLAEVEKSILIEALRRSGGQASVAAQSLKLPRKTFYDKLTKYGIRPESFR